MFYIPCLSSGWEIERCKDEVLKEMKNILEPLERLVKWEETHNMESMDFEEAKHKQLLDSVRTFIEE